MINYIEKDITTVERGIICHGVNCQGAMGSGVALAIKTKWPIIYVSFLNMPTGKTMLGTAHLIDVDEGSDSLFVANCYTQQFCGFGGRFADLDAIYNSLSKSFKWADIYTLDIFLPKIGAGLGGLDWETEVKPIIEKLDNEYERVTTNVCVFGE